MADISPLLVSKICQPLVSLKGLTLPSCGMVAGSWWHVSPGHGGPDAGLAGAPGRQPETVGRLSEQPGCPCCPLPAVRALSFYNPSNSLVVQTYQNLWMWKVAWGNKTMAWTEGNILQLEQFDSVQKPAGCFCLAALA